MIRLLSSILLVAVGAIVYHFAAPEFLAELKPAGLDSPGAIIA